MYVNADIVLSSGGESLSATEFEVSESLAGTRARITLDSDSPVPEPGRAVELSIETDRADTRFLLWCTVTRRSLAGEARFVEVECADPFTLAADHPVFRSWPGRCTLGAMVERVLEQDPGPLEQLTYSGPGGPQLEVDWFLQCNETGERFLRRLARRADQAVYWDRERLTIAPPGSGPPGAENPLRLERGTEVFEHWSCRGIDLRSQRLCWQDVTSRADRERQVSGDRNKRGVQPMVRCLSALASGATVADASPRVALPAYRTEELATGCPGLGLGRKILIGDKEYLVVEATHYAHGGGSYGNRVTAVPADRWGMTVEPASDGLLGPYQARITHNDDPLRQQRVRVALCGDPDGRPGPWIPSLSVSSGADAGCYWVPEVGDLVLVLAQASSPECLISVGALRGEDQKCSEGWNHDHNALKVLSGRGNVRIVMNDQERWLRLEAGETVLTLSADGSLEFDGKRMNAMASDEIALNGGDHVSIDAERIDLAPEG